MSKSELRQRMLEARRSIPPAQVSGLSLAVKANLEAQQEFGTAHFLISYAAMPDEVQTASIIEDALASGKRVALPAVEGADRLRFFEVTSLAGLVPGPFGIPEPNRTGPEVQVSDADAVLVPLVAFDASGNRLGRGKGYFDRALRARGRAVSVGLAFESQMVPELPVTPSDVPLDMLVTERRVLRFDGGRTGG